MELHGMSRDGDGAPFAGRVDGPTFVWKPMVGCPAVRERFSSGVSRRWRCVAKGAAQLLVRAAALWEDRHLSDTVLNTAARARRRLATMVQRGVTTQADDPTLAAAAAAVHHEGDPEALRALVATARAAAAKEEAAVALSRHRQWLTWLVGGHAQGLGRQHRFTKPRGGWVPSGVGQAPQPTRSCYDDVRGEAAERPDGREVDVEGEADCVAWTNLAVQHPEGRVPMNRQQVAEHQARWWSSFWGTGLSLARPRWPCDIGERALPRPTVAQMRAALRTFPAGAARPWDGTPPAWWRSSLIAESAN